MTATPPKRLVVAKVCLDTDGRYSLDAPSFDQGGTVGFGTQWFGQCSIEETVVGLRHVLQFFDEHLKEEAAKLAAPPKPAIWVPE